MSEAKKSRWGIGIVVLYGAFVVFILAIVSLASLQHFDMVEEHYYDREIGYQKNIETINRTAALVERPKIQFDGQIREATLAFPDNMPHDKVSGTVVMYRPSGAAMDVTIPIDLGMDNRQLIDLKKLPAGYWKAKLNWSVDKVEYYLEEPIFIN